MTRIFSACLCLYLLFFSMSALANTQRKTTGNVRVHSGPSQDSPVIATLPKGSSVTLLESKPSQGFYKVQTAAKQQGYISARYLAAVSTKGRALVHKPTNFEMEPHAIGLSSAKACVSDLASCPTNGCAAADSPHGLMNQLKQTVPSSTTPVLLTFDDFDNLQQQAHNLVGEDRELTAADRAQLKSMTVSGGVVSEGDLVSVVGYLVDTPHPNTGESVNCNLKGEANNDYHIPISNDPANTGFQGIVVEMIPQSRPANWSLANLTQVESGGQLVMVTGGLIYDNMHRVNADASNPERGQPARFSLFEVHPITQFVVCTRSDNKCDPAQASDWAPLGGGQ